MKHCLNCGTEFEGKFCPNCGAAWQEEKTCPHCGATLAGGVKFCNECGYSFLPAQQPPQNAEPQNDVQQPPQNAEPQNDVQQPPQNAEPQNDVQQPIAEVRPRRASSKGLTVGYAISRYLPAALLGLFALLLFLFYLAPAAVMPGGNFMGESIPSMSYGSLYGILSMEELASISGCACALIYFAIILAIYAAAAIYDLWKIHFKWKPSLYLSIGACVLYFILLLIGSILIGKIGKLDGGLGIIKAGDAPVLTVVFSCILLVFTAAAIGVRAYFETKHSEFTEAYTAAQMARTEAYAAARKARIEARIAEREARTEAYAAARKARVEARIAEREARTEAYRAAHAEPVPPEGLTAAPKRPKKPSSIYKLDTLTPEQREGLREEYTNFVRKKSVYAVTYPLILCALSFVAYVIIFVVYVMGFFYPLVIEFFSNASFTCIIYSIYIVIFGIAFIVLCIRRPRMKKRLVYGWNPKKVYCGGSVNFSLIFTTLLLICLSVIPHTFLLIAGQAYTSPINLALEIFISMGIVVIGMLIAAPLTIHKLRRIREPLAVKMCGYASPKQNPVLIEAYKQNLAEYNKELAQYRENRRAWKVYSCRSKMYEQEKEFEGVSYPKMWCSVHRVLLSIGAVLLAAVIVVTCVLATLDRRFTPGALQKIGLGAEQERVVEVLGKADAESTYQWTYYSSNYTSILKEMEEINEKSKDAQSDEQFIEYSKQYEALREELDSLEHQVITVFFSSEKTVTALLLDAHAKNGEYNQKEVKECSVSPEEIHRGDTVSYTVSYEDGSYAMRYFTESQLSSLDFSHSHSDTFAWADDWGSYSADIVISQN